MRGNTVRARWVTAVAGAATLALALSACGGTSSKTPAAGGSSGGGVILAFGSEPQNPLLPANTNETGGSRVMKLLFQGLISYDPQGKPINQVAESIDSKDSQNFTIKLKPGWKFTNGEPVNAKSFVDAWNFGALLTNAQLDAFFFEPIEGYTAVHPADEKSKPTAKTMTGLKVVDDLTFTVKLKAPQAAFSLRLGYNAFYPMPQSAYKDMKAFGENPIGNGPYTLDGKWEHNVQIKVKKNPDYKGSDPAKNAGVTVKVYTSPGAGYTDLQANNLDVMDQIPDSALASFKQDLGARAVNIPSGTFQSFSFPLYQPQWQGDSAKKVRQAISMAIDRKTITATIFQGTRTPAQDFTSPVVQGYSTEVCGEICSYNPTKAKALLKEAGGFTGKLEIAYNADGGHKAWVDATCNSIKNAIAIDCAGRSYPDFKSLRDPITKGTMKTAFRTGWQMDYPSIDDYMGTIYAKGAGSNDSHYDNPKFDALVKQADSAKSPEAGIKTYQDAEKLLVQDMPAVPLWYANTTGGYSEKVSNVTFDVFGVPFYTEVIKK